MLDNIQGVTNSRSAKSELNVNLFDHSYGGSDKATPFSPTDSQSSFWTSDATGFNLGGDSSRQNLLVPSLELVYLTDPSRTADRLQPSDNVSEVAQLPTESELNSAKVLEAVTKFAGENNLSVSSLDGLGVENVKQSWQSVFENCPKNGETKQTESGGQLTGLMTVGPDGRLISVKAGQIVDRFFQSTDGFYCHSRTVNTMYVPGELERVLETPNHTKIYMNNQIPANGQVRIDILLPDGKSGVQFNAQSIQIKEILRRINQPGNEHTEGKKVS